jgi:hypothetical protein
MEQHPLRFGQKVVTPIDRRAQGLVARQRIATTERQQMESVVETPSYLLY